jgi:hypothetical protein
VSPVVLQFVISAIRPEAGMIDYSLMAALKAEADRIAAT